MSDSIDRRLGGPLEARSDRDISLGIQRLMSHRNWVQKRTPASPGAKERDKRTLAGIETDLQTLRDEEQRRISEHASASIQHTYRGKK